MPNIDEENDGNLNILIDIKFYIEYNNYTLENNRNRGEFSNGKSIIYYSTPF